MICVRTGGKQSLNWDNRQSSWRKCFYVWVLEYDHFALCLAYLYTEAHNTCSRMARRKRPCATQLLVRGVVALHMYTFLLSTVLHSEWLTKLYKCCGLLAYETIAHGWAHWVGTVQCSTHSIVFSQSATRAYSTSYIHTYYRMDRHRLAWGSHVHFHYVICTALRAVMQCITRKQYIRALYSTVR